MQCGSPSSEIVLIDSPCGGKNGQRLIADDINLIVRPHGHAARLFHFERNFRRLTIFDQRGIDLLIFFQRVIELRRQAVPLFARRIVAQHDANATAIPARISPPMARFIGLSFVDVGM